MRLGSCDRLGSVIPDPVWTGKQFGGVVARLLSDRYVRRRRAVIDLCPTQLFAMLPNKTICARLVFSLKMLRLVQQYHCPLGVVRSLVIKIRVERYDLKRKICSSVGVILLC